MSEAKDIITNKITLDQVVFNLPLNERIAVYEQSKELVDAYCKRPWDTAIPAMMCNHCGGFYYKAPGVVHDCPRHVTGSIRVDRLSDVTC